MKLALYLVFLLAFATPCFADQPVGVTALEIKSEDRSSPLSLSLWYPATGGTAESVGGNAVFAGAQAGRDAAITDGKFPLVVISHGGLRSAANSGAWLSSALAQAGYIAVEINAPRPGSAREGVDEIWRRPSDVSHALDALLADPDWSKRIDQQRIFATGFALGGTAALVLAGGMIEPQAFMQSCRKDNGPDCAWYKTQGVGPDAVDTAQLAKPRRDRRIASVVAIAPEYLDAFSETMTAPDIPALLVGLGDDSGMEAADGIEVIIIPGASIFDGFQPCTPAGPAILAEDGGDAALCGASPAARRQVHDAIAGRIVSFLAEAAKQRP